MEKGGVVVSVPPNSCWPLNCVLPSETNCWTAESICWMTACRCEAVAVEPTTLRAADWTDVRRFDTLERVESVWLNEDLAGADVRLHLRLALQQALDALHLHGRLGILARQLELVARADLRFQLVHLRLLGVELD